MYRSADDHEWEEDQMPVTHKLAAGAAAGLIAQTAGRGGEGGPGVQDYGLSVIGYGLEERVCGIRH
jgi:hypothetical protein